MHTCVTLSRRIAIGFRIRANLHLRLWAISQSNVKIRLMNMAHPLSQDDAKKRPQFGGRFLTDSDNVFKHNAWDNVEWDEEQESEARVKVGKNTQTRVTDENQKKYEDEADVYWDEFYSQHKNRFFKDRHWLFTEFPELSGNQTLSPQTPVRASDGETHKAGTSELKNLDSGESKLSSELVEMMTPSSDCSCGSPQGEPQSGSPTNVMEGMDGFPGNHARFRILEVGCGVGNTIFPVLQINNDPGTFIYGCDLSTTAIQIVKEHTDYDPRRCHAFVSNVTDPECEMPFPAASLDVIVLIFILSSVHPDKMQSTIKRMSCYLKPGGVIVLRDYGRYDMAQLRFKDGQCLGDNFYVRGHGTRVYFFTQDDLRELFTKAGLVEVQNIVDRRLQVNRGKQIKMYRVWIQCKYRKSPSS